MKKKAISIIVAAIIIVGGGTAIYTHHKDSHTKSTTVLSSQNKTATQDSNIYLLSKADKANNLEGISTNNVTILHNNKAINKKPIQNVTALNYVNNGYIYTALTNDKTLNLYKMTLDGKVQLLTTMPVESAYSVNPSNTYAYWMQPKKLSILNLKTDKILNLKASSNNTLATSVTFNSTGDILYTLINNITNIETNYIYDSKTKQTIEVSSTNATTGTNYSFALNDGFVVISNNQIKYFNNSNSKISDDSYSVKPSNVKPSNDSEAQNSIGAILYTTSNKMIYSYNDADTYYLVSKVKNQKPEIIASNIDGTILKSSVPYIIYSQSGKTYSYDINKGTNKLISNSILNVKKAYGVNKYIYTSSMVNKNIETSQTATELLKNELNNASNSFNIEKFDAQTGKLEQVATKVSNYVVTNNNLTTIKKVLAYHNQNLTTPSAYDIYFNNKEIAKNIVSYNIENGHILYTDNTGTMYELYNGTITKLPVNPLNYAVVSNNIFNTANHTTLNYLNGYWESTNPKGEKIIYSKYNSLLTIVNNNKIIKATIPFKNLEKNDYLSIVTPPNPEAKKLSINVIDFNNIKVDSTSLKRIPASEYSKAYESAIKANPIKNTNPININGTDFYAYSNNIMNTMFTSANGFHFFINGTNKKL